MTGKTNTELLNCQANGNNQLTTCSITYDTAGNTIQNGTTAFSYDAENRLSTTAGYTYSYDGDGNRVEKTNGSTTTLYWYGATGEVLTETSGTGSITGNYIFFAGRRIAMRDSTGAVSYFLSDHLGSASVVASSVGTIRNESDYYPYGGEMVISGSNAPHYKFTGKERDSESGLDNFGARYDSSSLGRFMTPDWAAKPTTVPNAVFGDPQTLNLYAYVENAPINRADADGHVPPSRMFTPCESEGDLECRNRNQQEEWREELDGKPQVWAQNTAADKPAPQPAPTDPQTGKPTPPPVPVPGAPDLGWKWNPNDQNPRGGTWGPDGWKGPNPPNGSWDPAGHWDINRGKGEPVDHYDPKGNPITPGTAHPGNAPAERTMMDRMRSITPGPIVKWGTTGIVIYIIIDEGSRLYPPRNLVPVP